MSEFDEYEVHGLHLRTRINQSVLQCSGLPMTLTSMILYMVRPSPARRHIQCTATRDIFRRPHEETSALSGAHSVSEPVSRKAKLSGCIAILVMLPLYMEFLAIESSEQRKASGTL